MGNKRGPGGSGSSNSGGQGGASQGHGNGQNGQNGQKKKGFLAGEAEVGLGDLNLGGLGNPESWLPGDEELEKLGAELERGWQLIDRWGGGDSGALDQAKELGLDLLKRYPDTPEAMVLLGMIDSLEGDVEAALSRYEQASELDPEYVEPLLSAAELYIWELGEDEKGLSLCQRAQEIAEEEEEFLDALLLQAEAEINLGRERAAKGTLRQLPDVDLPDVRYHIRAGRLFLDLEELDEAVEHFQHAIEHEPENGDALHGLGMCAEQRGNREQMISYFRKLRLVDLREDRPPWGLDEQRFQEVCAEAIDDMPDELRKLLGNVPVLASDYPSEQMVEDGTDPRILGLFAGIPHSERVAVGGNPSLETIHIFQRNIERLAYSPEDVEQEIRVTLAHEAGHFFGLSEAQLEAMGLG